ncbi:Kelch repeat-containing protein, partial [Croceitalea sp. MTPC5]|uniref:Kelch repeat-containing protein n=1 Tax=Croceitalea sp. MTPC5 TaxID=3056565 RepID=UPI0030CC986B
MKKNYFRGILVFQALILLFSSKVFSQSFTQTQLDFNGLGDVSNGVTSLMFGPDGRLYVAEYPGLIKILTVTRNSATDYEVTAIEVLDGIQSIANHNDDGTSFAGVERETTGLTVAGTSEQPIIYVNSSDFRIGGGFNGGNGDVDLDTNSGVITRLTWNGSGWDTVDIVRGLPRSEENHANNGLEFTTINGREYLIVAQGGNANAGAPSVNFAFLTEYALSAAVLSIDLTALEEMPILNDNGRAYIYDLPTLDDPTRPNIDILGNPASEDPQDANYSPIDINDPWGGNDGLNQAKLVIGGPVQIFSPGYRNAYDLVVTQSGAVYVTDNGANGGWGGFPTNEGGGNATNFYDPSEPGSSSASGSEQINNEDHLELITTDIQNYLFGSFYAGHPNPIRANPSGAGLFTAPDQFGTANAVFRTELYDPDGSTLGSTTDPNIGLPADWPPVPLALANTVEGDWRGPRLSNPDGPTDKPVVIWGTNTNGIDEYTASNFNGAMQGDLIAGVNNGLLRRVQLDENGLSAEFTPNFASGLGGNALGVSCNSDTDIFPGTIWVGMLGGSISVLEPQDFVECLVQGDVNYDPQADNDNDGYTNQDELDNGTDICNGGARPNDFDFSVGGQLVSDFNDPDDDADGIPDAEDPFQLGDPTTSGSDAFTLPVFNSLFSDTHLGGFLGLGMTGLMNNGASGANWLDYLDRRDDTNDPNPNDILGGAIGAMTMQMTSGTALGLANTQEKGFQYGIQVDSSTGIFTVSGSIGNFNQPLQLYGNSMAPNGELGLFIGDGTQRNYIKFVLTPSGIFAQQEIGDIPRAPISLAMDAGERPTGNVVFFFVVNPQTGQIILEYNLDGNGRQTLGTIMAEGAILTALQNTTLDLAVGLIGTSNAPGVEVEGTWDFLNVNLEDTGETDNANLAWVDKDDQENYSARHENGFVQAGNRFYLIGGRESANVDVYDYTTNSWSTLPESAPVLLNHFQCVEYNGLIWILASLTGDNFPNDIATEHIWIFDPANEEWIQGPEIPENRRRGAAGVVVYDGRFYIVGGNTNGHNGGYVPWFDEYDPQTGTWTPLEDAPIARDHFQAIVMDDNLYVMGGRQSGGTQIFAPAIAQVDVYNFTTQTWSTLDAAQNMPTPRIGAMLAMFNNRIIAVGGSVRDQIVDGEFIEDAVTTISEEFDPVSETWRRLQDTNFGRRASQAIVSGDGVFITAGSDLAPAGGFQHNLECLGGANPVGDPLVPSVVQSPSTLNFNATGSQEAINIQVADGNTGVIINSVQVLGTGSENFSFPNGNLVNQLLLPGSTHELAVSYNGLPSSPITLQIQYNNSGFLNIDLTIDGVSSPPSREPLLRINAGGPQVTLNGIVFSADSNFTGGNGFANTNASVSPLYQTERSSNPPEEFSYDFVVPNGEYEVVLHFAEIYFGANGGGSGGVGSRIFDVTAEGSLILDDYDIFAEVGAESQVTRSFLVSITDGELNLYFDALGPDGVDQPKLSALELYTSSPSDFPIITASPIANQFNEMGGIVSGLTAMASGGDPSANFIFSIAGQPEGIGIDSVTGEISGIIDSGASVGGTNGDGIYNVTVTVAKAGSLPDEVSFTWTIMGGSLCLLNNAADANFSRFQARSEILDDKIYVMGGWSAGINANDHLEIYDISNDTWTVGADLPEPLTHMGSVVAENQIWLIGGIVGNLSSNTVISERVHIYDIATDTWSLGPDLPMAVASGEATLNGNIIHFFGGLEDDVETVIGNHFTLDVTNLGAGWATAAPMLVPRNHHSAETVNGIVYAIGGQIGHLNPREPVTTVEAYDSATDTWTPVADLPAVRSHFEPGTTVFDGRIIIVGGQEENGVFSDDVTQYDPSTNQWSNICTLHNPRQSAVAQAFGNRLFISGGGINGTSDLVPTTQWLQLNSDAPQFPPVEVDPIVNQFNFEEDTVGSFGVAATGGNPAVNFNYAIEGQPSGISIEPTNGLIFGTIDIGASSGGINGNGVYTVVVTVSKPGSLPLITNFTWTVESDQSDTDVVWWEDFGDLADGTTVD